MLSLPASNGYEVRIQRPAKNYSDLSQKGLIRLLEAQDRWDARR